MKVYFRPTSKISFVQWGGDTVVYNHGSACTHMISDVPAEVLNIIFSGQAFSDAELQGAIKTAFPDFSSDDNRRFFQEVKVQLMGMELIETI